jgi:hypothetical protein
MPADLAELLHHAAPEPAAPVDPERLWRAGRRRRYRKVAATLTVLSVAVLWAVDTGSREHDEDALDVSTSDRILIEDPAQGFSVEYPSTWRRATTDLTPNLTDPVEILSLGTGYLVPGGRSCAQLPMNALKAMSPTDGFVSVQEQHSAPTGLFPDRPDRFPPPGYEGDSEVAACLSRPPKVDSWWIRFQDAGRAFYVLVAIGRQASEETRAETWAILDSLRFGPLPEPSGAVITGTLLDGQPWTVRHDAVHGLCVMFGEANLGCDDQGPVIGPDADPAIPRLAPARSARSPDSGSLVYGFLPPGATRVELIYDGGPRIPTGLVVEPDERFWAAPVDPEDIPHGVGYRDDGGVIWMFGLRSR